MLLAVTTKLANSVLVVCWLALIVAMLMWKGAK